MQRRRLGDLTSPEFPVVVPHSAVFVIPFGSREQHGRHLPLDTDTVIAEQFAQRLTDRYGEEYDLWLLPTIPYGVSPEHDWAQGTVTLPSNLVVELLSAIIGAHARSTGVRAYLIVNGHGGNRGVLETALREISNIHGVRVCAIHPMSSAREAVPFATVDVHAGLHETSVMLAVAPDLVRTDRTPSPAQFGAEQASEIHGQVSDRFLTWPWTSNDPSIAVDGVIGDDPSPATAEIGEQIVARALERIGPVLERLAHR
jgi:creatinine amidohydrolase